ncbi:uncharacterized protein [Littorina saxatilis]|uniref:uncharacterized protein n=1 Tax=Littorina saxatilis TaxID=31220 RepID=UPI0038B58EA4
MDISVGPQEFQRKTTETLSGLEGFDEIMDDVTRRTKNTSPLEIMKSGFELNREKYQFMNRITIRQPVTSSRAFERFINTLHPKIPSLSVWCASVHKLESLPFWMCERQLTTPLRCPPTVTKEVAKSKEMKGSGIPSYSSTPAPAATEGPPVRWLPHKGGQDGHSKGTAMNCNACGDAVVQLLKELGVGQSSGPDSLQYRDVLVLGPSERVQSKGNDSKRAAKGLTGKLLDSGIPMQIVTEIDGDTKYRDVALGLKNEVTVSDYETVAGLERRVVIGTGSSSDQAELLNRLMAMSRCTAQLVWIGDITQR